MNVGKNAINNTTWKENLVNGSAKLVKQRVHYDTTFNTSAEFGYLFDFGDGDVEALFKVVTDTMTCYFALQKSQLMLLEFNDILFDEYTRIFLELHSEQNKM